MHTLEKATLRRNWCTKKRSNPPTCGLPVFQRLGQKPVVQKALPTHASALHITALSNPNKGPPGHCNLSPLLGWIVETLCVLNTPECSGKLNPYGITWICHISNVATTVTELYVWVSGRGANQVMEKAWAGHSRKINCIALQSLLATEGLPHYDRLVEAAAAHNFGAHRRNQSKSESKDDQIKLSCVAWHDICRSFRNAIWSTPVLGCQPFAEDAALPIPGIQENSPVARTKRLPGRTERALSQRLWNLPCKLISVD